MDSNFEAKYQMKLQTQVIESCFKDCVNSFKEEQMTSAERVCIANCGTRYLKAFEQFGQVAQSLQQSQGGMGSQF